MKNCESIFLGKTFDDILLRPQMGTVATRKQVDLTMPFSPKLSINLPIVASNMDTVTGAKMMQAMSLEGAFAILHRNCGILEQVTMVRSVKKQHSHIVENPLIISPDETIADAIKLTEEHNISGLLIEEKKGSRVLVGILSRRDLEFAKSMNAFHEKAIGFKGLQWPLTINYADVPMDVAEKMMLDSRVEKLPLVDKENHIVGLITLKDLRAVKQKPYSSKDAKGRLLVGAAIGATGDFMERAQELVSAGVDCVVIDIAHAHSVVVKQAIEKFKKKFENTELICGNIATAEAAEFLLNLGVDAIKVGIGPGMGCRTRLETGFGVPQLQAIREVYLAVNGQIPIIADAGMKNDKDFFLAIACGASSVMSGGIFAGTDESPGKIITDPATGQKFKIYRGMTSPEAVIANVPEEEMTERLSTPAEGQSAKIPYVGSVKNILERIRGHLQSAVSYSGEQSLMAAHKKIAADPGKYFILLSEAAKKESYIR